MSALIDISSKHENNFCWMWLPDLFCRSILCSNETGTTGIIFSGNYTGYFRAVTWCSPFGKVLRHCLLFQFTLIAKSTEVILFVCPFDQPPTPFTWLLCLPHFWDSSHFSAFTEQCKNSSHLTIYLHIDLSIDLPEVADRRQSHWQINWISPL